MVMNNRVRLYPFKLHKIKLLNILCRDLGQLEFLWLEVRNDNVIHHSRIGRIGSDFDCAFRYNTVTAIQNNLRDCLEDLTYALAFVNGMTEQGYEFICDFKDSILVDEETERQQDRVDMQMGIMRPEEYRAKWYGESVEEALKNLPQSAEVLE